ncbi:MAG TPA: alpha/beta fold hydrolase [Blastocatellia bacterium]|nr:alpha/beta fold hydrolase [Blastocatellia bacterium]
MHVECYGSGSRVYFGLHGWSGDYTTFAPLAAYLPAGVALYSADLPGYGRSPAPRRWELSEITDEIARAIAAVDSPVSVIGACSGAVFALLAAERLAGRIERLILIDPFAYLPLYFKIFLHRRIGRYAYYSTFANPLGRWLTNLSLSRHRTADTNLTESFVSVSHDVAYRYLALMGDINDVSRFSRLRLPVDLIYGARTFGAIKKSIHMWRDIWPHARCHELAGAGHLPIQEATAQLSEIVFA